jgi:hypothetical protein
MVELERRISGDWIDSREAAADQYRLTEHFKLGPERLHALATEMRKAVEEGLLEYKEVTLKPFFNALEAVQYQSLSAEELQRHEQPLAELVYAVLLQRLLCSGAIPLSRDRSAARVSTAELPVNDILADVKERVRRDAAFQRHPSVKNIYVQVSLYQRERRKMEELLPTIKPEKRPVFQANFQATFQRIFDSIRRHYSDLLTEEEARKRQEEGREHLLYRLNLSDLTPVLAAQAQEVSRLRSTLAFAREDKFKTRGILVNLYRQRERVLGLVERERHGLARLCAAVYVPADRRRLADLSNRLRAELTRVLEKLARLATPA